MCILKYLCETVSGLSEALCISDSHSSHLLCIISTNSSSLPPYLRGL